MITTPALLKQHILTTLEQLPEQTLPEVVLFLDYLQYRNKHQEQQQTRYHSVSVVCKPISSPAWTLEQLLAGVHSENMHHETDTGDVVGNEVW